MKLIIHPNIMWNIFISTSVAFLHKISRTLSGTYSHEKIHKRWKSHHLLFLSFTYTLCSSFYTLLITLWYLHLVVVLFCFVVMFCPKFIIISSRSHLIGMISLLLKDKHAQTHLIWFKFFLFKLFSVQH